MNTATKTQPTKEQWEQIAKDLDCQNCPVFLRCDGYLISACMRRSGPNKLAIQVGVNGWEFKGEWLPKYGKEPRPMSEEARRFWMPSKKMGCSQPPLKLFEKVYGKRECRRRGLYDPIIWPRPEWNRPLPLIRHLKKHNQVIEVLDYETYKREIEAIRERELGDG